MAHTTETLTIRDVRLALRRAGSGSPVLFLHGAGGVMVWLPFFDAIAKTHALLVPDHPGFGGSDDPKWIRHVPDLAMFYLDVLDEQRLEGVHVIGSSIGGWLAAEMAIRNTARIASLTLISPAGIRVKGHTSGDIFMWSPEETARNLFHDQSFAERMIAQPPSETDADIALKNRFAAAKYGWQPRLYNPDLEKWLHRIRIPTQLIWGEEDRILPPAWAPRWRQCIPDAKLTMLPRCGHLPHVEKMDAVLDSISRHIGGVKR